MNYSVIICNKDGSLSQACDRFGRPFCVTRLADAKAKVDRLVAENKGLPFIDKYVVRAWTTRSDVYQVVYIKSNESAVSSDGVVYRKEGYYAQLYGFECFYVTSQQRKTQRLVTDFINKVQNRLNTFYDFNVEDYMPAVLKATLVKKQLQNGPYAGKYTLTISGEDFGGYGPNGVYDNPEAAMIIVEG